MAWFSETLLSGQQSADSFAGNWLPVPTAIDLAFSAFVTAGSFSALDVWIQYSPDKSEARAVDVVLDVQLPTADAAASGTVSTNVRDLINNKTTTTPESFYGLIRACPSGYIRAKGKKTGSNVTVEVNVQGK